MNISQPFAPRLLAGFGMLALLGGIGLASSRPARTAGGPVPVTVANVPLPSLPTDVAAPSQPVGVQGLATVTNGFGRSTVYTVPAGKRLVVETVSATTEYPADTPNSFSVLVLDGSYKHFIAFPVQPSGSLATGSQAVHFYADAGTTINGNVFGKSGVNDMVGVGLTGYLVDAPGAATQPASVPDPSARSGMATQE